MHYCSVPESAVLLYPRITLVLSHSLQFHRECIDQWLHSGHTTCPIDGQPVHDPSKERRRRLNAQRSTAEAPSTPTRRRYVGSLAHALSRHNSLRGESDEELEFTVSGQSIGIASGQER